MSGVLGPLTSAKASAGEVANYIEEETCIDGARKIHGGGPTGENGAK